MQSKILIALATAAPLLGAIVVVGSVTVWPVIAGTNMCFLTTRYDPNGDPHYQTYRPSNDLYRLTKRIAEQHSDFAMRLLCTLGLSFFAVGVTLLAWSLDRDRLYRKVRDPKQQDVKGSDA